MGSEFVKRKSSVWAKKSDTKPSMFAPRPFVVNQKPLFPPRPFEAPAHYQEDTVSKKELPLEIPPANYITSKMGYASPQPTVQRQEENLEEKEPEQEAEVNLKSDAPPADEESKVDLKADASSTPPYSIFPKLNFGASQPAVQRQETFKKEQEEDSQLDLKSDEAIQAKCSDCESEAQQGSESVQTKLTVGEPGDKYEQEADTVAAKVVEHINSPQTEQPVQGKVEPVVKPTLMRQGGAGAGTVNHDVEQNIQQARGGGQGLAEDVRQPMEQAFGADFSGVKVHTDGQADVLNRSLNSRAFATGQDIFFKQGEYNPGNKQGQELLAHELTHVVQQGDGVQTQIQRECGVDESCIEKPSSSYTKGKTDNYDLTENSTNSQELGFGISYDFDDLPSQTLTAGAYSVTLSMIGNLKLTPNLSEKVIASKEGMALSVEKVFRKVTTVSDIKVKDGSIFISNGIGVRFLGQKISQSSGLKISGGCIASEYKCDLQPIDLNYLGYSISGKIGYKVEARKCLDKDDKDDFTDQFWEEIFPYLVIAASTLFLAYIISGLSIQAIIAAISAAIAGLIAAES